MSCTRQAGGALVDVLVVSKNHSNKNVTSAAQRAVPLGVPAVAGWVRSIIEGRTLLLISPAAILPLSFFVKNKESSSEELLIIIIIKSCAVLDINSSHFV